MRKALPLLLLLSALLAGCATTANPDPMTPTSTAGAAAAPVAWVNELADELTHGTRATNYAIEEGNGVVCTLPQGFTKYHESRWLTRAVSIDSVCIKVTRQENVKGGTLDYWAALIQRTLETTRGLSMTPPRALVLDDGKPAMQLNGVKQIRGENTGYLVAFTVTPRHVYLFEAWGPQAPLVAAMPALETAVKSIKVSWMADVLL